MDRLSDEQITNELASLADWERVDENWIERKYRFKKYLSGVKFVDQVAQFAENKQHHPLISIDYKKVTVKFSSWQEKGLTALDLEMAKRVDELYVQAEK
ncbi:4a-hydroxytetrahydrobiopterin dehydratase [Virgibacillus necropolis]|uniref:4a-hydroxytetrahydrobiopterin dehydratase n=1 Tax=Virgibacillus necropolis TaxID=163877 RepID=UPI00384F6265